MQKTTRFSASASETRLSFLLALSDRLRLLTDPASIVSAACELLGRHLGVGRCSYGEIDEKLQTVTIGQDWTDGVMASAKGRHRIGDFGPDFMAAGSGASLAIPLMKDGRWAAAIYVQQAAPRQWTAGEEILVTEVGERIWAAVRRARAEAAQRESEELSRSLFESIDEAVMIIEPMTSEAGLRDWRFVGMNQRTLAMFGKPDMTGQTMRGTFPDEDEAWYDTYEEVYRSGRIVRLERWSAPQGKMLDVFVARIGEPAARRLLVVIQDVTDRRRAADQLKQSEEHQAFLLQLSDALRPLTSPADIQFEACRLLAERLGADRACFVHIDEAAGTARIDRDFVRPGSVSLTGLHRLEDFAWSVEILRRGERIVIADTQDTPLVPPGDRAACAALQIIGCMATPLIKGGALVGALNVTTSAARLWAPWKTQLLQLACERVWAAMEEARAEELLRDSEQRYRELANSLPLIVWQTDPQGVIRYVNDRFTEITGRPASDVIGEPWLFKLHGDDQRRVDEAWAGACSNGTIYETEIKLALPGGVRWFLSRGVPVKDEAGTVLRWVGSDIDITDRKTAEEHTRFLMREVNHRSKNILAVVQSLARQTASETDPRNYAARLGERLQGLAASQDLLVRNEWKRVALTDLIRSQLAHFDDSDVSRIRLEGEPLNVTAGAAQNLGMALHELGTNAGKYGALSRPEGTIAISWSVEPGHEGKLFVMTWREQNGPPVTPPKKRGLGTLLTTRLTERSLAGKVELDFQPGGVVWRLEAPAGNVIEGCAEPSQWPA